MNLGPVTKNDLPPPLPLPSLLPGEQKVAEFYDQNAPTYDDHYKTGMHLAEDRYIFGREGVGRYDGRRVIDLGCGTGLYLHYCQPSVYTGVDISEGMLAVARDKFKVGKWNDRHRWVRAPMEDLADEPAGFYDAAISTFGGFSYCQRPTQAVAEMARVTKPNGEAFVMAFSPRYLKRKSHIAGNGIPFNVYSAYTLQVMFESFGFATVHVSGFHCLGESLFARLPEGFHSALLAVESMTVSPVFPNVCYCLIVEASKRKVYPLFQPSGWPKPRGSV